MGAANRDSDREDAGKRQFVFLQIKSSDGKGRGDLPVERRRSFAKPSSSPEPIDMKQLLNRYSPQSTHLFMPSSLISGCI